MPSRFIAGMASALLALAIALPASAQGNSGSAPGKNKPSSPPPTSNASVSAATNMIAPAATTAAAPFAWLDDASLMEPGTVWLGVSMVTWRGSGLSDTIGPVFDGAVGLTPRVQLGASVPRVAGGLGTTFFSAKIGILNDDARSLKVAIGPTLEVLSSASMQWGPAGQARAQWGLPVSIQFDRGAARIYGSSGYFSPGIWYAGGGIGRPVSDRVGVSVSFSHAWTSTASTIPAVAGPRRNDLSGGASFDVTPNIAVFGSVGRTIGTAAEDGAGTTVSFGLSLSAGPMFTR